MKLKNLILTIAVMLIVFGVNQTNAQEGGWTRVSSTMNSDTLYLVQGDAQQGNYFVRTKLLGDNVSDQVIWSKGGLGNIPFQGILKVETRSHVFQTGVGTRFQVLLHHNDTTISSAFVNISVGPWYTQSRSSWSGTLSVFDSLSIVEMYNPLTTVFVEKIIDFDNFRVTLDGQDYLFYDGGEWASVSGTVWFDQNQNSVRDEGEKPLRGLKVYLGNGWLDSSYTDSAGQYQFQRRERGAHIIKPEPREFWTVTTHASGESTLVIANNPLYYTNIDFGLYSPQASLYSINRGWNIISVPKTGNNMAKTNLYPGATSSAFAYTSSGYAAQDTLETGKGYWLKFTDTEVVLAGEEVLQDTIEIASGWNMIGAVSQTISINDIVSDPPGLRVSQFYGYTGRYYETDSLKPNQGYWVKAIETGQIILKAGTLKFAKTTGQNIVIVPTAELPPPPPESKTLGIDEPVALPTEFTLEQNYPNPFNPSTTIKYEIPKQVWDDKLARHAEFSSASSWITLKVYNLLGQEVATLVNEMKAAGKYTVSFNGSNLTSGIYFYRLQTGGYNETKKMLLLK